MDLSDYIPRDYGSFNDFFTREIRPEKRPVDDDPRALISPCDGRLTVYRATEDAVFTIKHSRYRLADLVGDEELAARFRGGDVLVFRLCVDDYHRYCYFDSGVKGDNHFIPGVLHTVQPIALEQEPVFVRNSREWTLLNTDHFGPALQVEVGALLVGRIANGQGAGAFERGREKGRFLFGGSTIVVVLQPGAARLEERFRQASARGEELRVLQGQRIGQALTKKDCSPAEKAL